MSRKNLEQKGARPDLFAKIQDLEESPEIWQPRTISTIDLSEGLDTYIEHLTIDVDQDYVSPVDDYYYLPVGWRKRESFLELDCQTNSGDSMQLMPLAFRRDYMEWKFWAVCHKLGLVAQLPKVCDCLREHLSKIIADPTEVRSGGQASSLHVQCNRKWQEIERDLISRELLAKIRMNEPLIFRVRACRHSGCESDISILKISERKTLFAPKDPGFRRYGSNMWGMISSFSANTNKVVAPRDVRLVRGHCYEMVVGSDSNELEAQAVEPFADGNWLHLRREISSPTLVWLIEFRPRRGFLYKPGRTTVLLSLLATVSWLLLFKQSYWEHCEGIFVSSCDIATFANSKEIVKTVMSSIPFGLLFAYYLTRLPLFQQSQDRSFLYDVWTRPHFRLLAWVIGLAILFPFLNSFDFLSGGKAFYGKFVSVADLIQVLIIAFQTFVLVIFQRMCYKIRPNVAS